MRVFRKATWWFKKLFCSFRCEHDTTNDVNTMCQKSYEVILKVSPHESMRPALGEHHQMCPMYCILLTKLCLETNVAFILSETI